MSRFANSDESQGIYRRLFTTAMILIAVSGISLFVIVSIDRAINGNDPEPLVIFSAQQGKMKGNQESVVTHQTSGYGNEELEFQQRDLQYCPINMAAYGTDRTKRKAAYNCGYALGLVGCSATYCNVGISRVRYFKVRLQWYVDCYCY